MKPAVSNLAFQLAGAGIYEPRTVVTSEDLDVRQQWKQGTAASFGIDERRYAAPDETSSMMGAEATRRAIADAGWKVDDIDALIGACGVMEQPIPGTAPLVQRRLGLGSSGISAFDVNATCLSFLPALDHALAGIALGRWQRVVIFSSDIASAALDHKDPESSAIFGDGAAAIALTAGQSQLLTSRFETYGEHAELCRLEAGGTRLRPHDDLDDFLAHSHFRMEGMALFRATARQFPGFLSRLISESGVSLEAIDTIIPHQASRPAIRHLAQAIGDKGRIIDVFAKLGNRIAASMPHALAIARDEGHLLPGSISLLIGSSAGISLGGAVIRW
jgi:3-oxoacyl-[acyl-carrier-protein] synthase-3